MYPFLITALPKHMPTNVQSVCIVLRIIHKYYSGLQQKNLEKCIKKIIIDKNR